MKTTYFKRGLPIIAPLLILTTAAFAQDEGAALLPEEMQFEILELRGEESPMFLEQLEAFSEIEWQEAMAQDEGVLLQETSIQAAPTTQAVEETVVQKEQPDELATAGSHAHAAKTKEHSCGRPPCEICPWTTVNFVGEFIYWQAIEENLEPCGIVTSLIAPYSAENPTFTGLNSGVIQGMNFDYKPGFRVGFGIGFDREYLDLSGDYTRFISTDKISGSGNEFYPSQLDPATLLAFLNGITVASGGFGNAFPFSYNQTWQLKMNLADLDLGRMHYDGKVFKSRTFFGVRAAWIDQSLYSSYIANYINGGPEVGSAFVKVNTKSWGVGLRTGLDTTWKLGGGFQFYGNGIGDILYTQYKWQGVANATVPTVIIPSTSPVEFSVDWNSDVTQSDIVELRLHADLEAGFRWSTCFNDNKCRFDLGAGYSFQVFFDQNMFRLFTVVYEELGIFNVGSPATPTPFLTGVIGTPLGLSPHGNLYIQGLNVTAGFTF